jgi:hypothetical protein
MKQKHADYKIAPYPKFRRFESIMLRSLLGMSMIHGLIEVDVTRTRAFMREHKAKTGETLSFTAFISPSEQPIARLSKRFITRSGQPRERTWHKP